MHCIDNTASAVTSLDVTSLDVLSQGVYSLDVDSTATTAARPLAGLSIDRAEPPRASRPKDDDFGGGDGDGEGDTGTVTVTRTGRKLKKPSLYKVLFHNDDYTTREFVVFVLRSVFHHSEDEAVRIMWHVHTNGVGLAGVFTYEIAETKARKTEALARDAQFPLRVSVEPE